MAPTPAHMTDLQLELLIERAATRAAEQAIARAFGNLGVDPSSPANLRDWHADQLWTRQAREGSIRLSNSMKTSIAGTLATAILYAIWRLFLSGPPA